MPFTNYTELQAEVLSFLNRSADTDAIAKCPSWITLAEDEMRMSLTRLLVRQGEVVDSAFAITTEYTALPVGFYRQRALKLNTDPVQSLDYTMPQAADRWNDMESAGKPKLFTIQGNQLRVSPPPDAAYTATFTYYALPSLSDGNPTNWMLTAHPKLYLIATLAEAAIFYEDVTKASLFEQKRDSMLSNIYTSDGSDQQGSAMRMRIDGRVI